MSEGEELNAVRKKKDKKGESKRGQRKGQKREMKLVSGRGRGGTEMVGEWKTGVRYGRKEKIKEKAERKRKEKIKKGDGTSKWRRTRWNRRDG